MRAGSEVLSHRSRGPAPSAAPAVADVKCRCRRPSRAAVRRGRDGKRLGLPEFPWLPPQAACRWDVMGMCPRSPPRGYRGADSEPAAGSAAQPRGLQPAPRPQGPPAGPDGAHARAALRSLPPARNPAG